MFDQPPAALDALSVNPADDVSLRQEGMASHVVLDFVGRQLRRSLTSSSWQVRNRRNCIHASLKHLGVVPVRAAGHDHQLHASGIYNDVSLGTEFAPVCRVGSRLLTPPWAWYQEAINAGPAPIDLFMFAQASQYGPVNCHGHHPSHAGAASKSCRCRIQGTREGLSMESLFAERT